MIVIDRTSFWALINNAPSSAIQRAINESDAAFIFIAQQTFQEATQANIEERGQAGIAALEQQMEELEITVVPSIRERTAATRTAFERYGEGRCPGSSLTLGDCAAYTRAKTLGADLVSERLEAYEIMGLEWMTIEYILAERDKRLARQPSEIRARMRAIWRDRDRL